MQEKNVQTTVTEVVYNVLWSKARKDKRPLKAVVREALEEYAARAMPVEGDPLLKIVGIGKLKETNWSTRKDWRA